MVMSKTSVKLQVYSNANNVYRNQKANWNFITNLELESHFEADK